MNTEQKIEATTHELKTWPEYFEAVKYGKKTFELRHNDRNFQVGDELILKEWIQYDVFSSYDSHDPRIDDGHYTGEEIRKTVTYVLTGENVKRFGLMDGFCILGIAGRSAGLEREKEIIGAENPFPLQDVLFRLANAAKILLHKKNYDGGDYEEIELCVKRAEEIQQLLK